MGSPLKDGGNGFRSLAGTSALFAAASFGLPFAMGRDRTDLTFQIGCPLSLLWLTLVIASARYGRRALWTLLGAPLALFWPIALGALFFSCAVYNSCP
jgi:hypothetical protein